MRCPRCQTETPADALACPKCKLLTPKGRTSRSLKLTDKEKDKEKRGKLKRYILVAVSVVVIGGVGGYIYLTVEFSSGAEPRTALNALENLKKLPSNENGYTVDQRLNRALKESQDSGRLARYQGWHIRPVPGTKTKVLLVFSYEEKDGTQHRAEWIADFSTNSFSPQNSLAAAVYSKQ